jgi:toxin ParE1/3/4
VRLDWSQRSISDLQALHDYIARDSRLYAERFIASLIRAAERLADFPELGRRVPEEPDQSDVRELLVQTYRVIYRVEAERILIATIVHGRRNLEAPDDKPWNAP